MPVPSITNQILVAILWIGLAAALAIIIVATVFLINRIKSKKSCPKQIRDSPFSSAFANY
jgi:hypothetical protein